MPPAPRGPVPRPLRGSRALRRQELTRADIDAGCGGADGREKLRQEHCGNGIRGTDGKTAGGRCGLEWIRAGDDATHADENVGNRRGKLRRAGRGYDTLWRAQEERIVEQPPQPAESMADGRRRQIQPFCRPPDMTLGEHDMEEVEKIEVGAGEVDFIQHDAEIISLDLPQR